MSAHDVSGRQDSKSNWHAWPCYLFINSVRAAARGSGVKHLSCDRRGAFMISSRFFARLDPLIWPLYLAELIEASEPLYLAELVKRKSGQMHRARVISQSRPIHTQRRRVRKSMDAARLCFQLSSRLELKSA